MSENAQAIPTDEPEISSPMDELQKISKLGDADDQVICRIRTVFPVDLFPTALTIERTKVNIIETLFFSSTQIQSILIEEIATVERSSSLFFATLTIHNKIPNREPYIIANLRKEDAAQAQRIIQGLMVSSVQKIDLFKIPLVDLLPQLEKIGMSHASIN